MVCHLRHQCTSLQVYDLLVAYWTLVTPNVGDGGPRSTRRHLPSRVLSSSSTVWFLDYEFVCPHNVNSLPFFFSVIFQWDLFVVDRLESYEVHRVLFLINRKIDNI